MTDTTASVPSKIRFFFIKSNYFRVVHVDGAFGGLTPQGKIFVSIYSERGPIPETITHTVTNGIALGEEITAERKSKDGIIREVEVGLTMDLAAAEAIRKWLGDQIELIKKFKVPEGT